jgi:hypothetical protein
MVVEWNQTFHPRQKGTNDEACSSQAHDAKVKDVVLVLEGV